PDAAGKEAAARSAVNGTDGGGGKRDLVPLAAAGFAKTPDTSEKKTFSRSLPHRCPGGVPSLPAAARDPQRQPGRDWPRRADAAHRGVLERRRANGGRPYRAAGLQRQ